MSLLGKFLNTVDTAKAGIAEAKESLTDNANYALENLPGGLGALEMLVDTDDEKLEQAIRERNPNATSEVEANSPTIVKTLENGSIIIDDPAIKSLLENPAIKELLGNVDLVGNVATHPSTAHATALYDRIDEILESQGKEPLELGSKITSVGALKEDLAELTDRSKSFTEEQLKEFKTQNEYAAENNFTRQDGSSYPPSEYDQIKGAMDGINERLEGIESGLSDYDKQVASTPDEVAQNIEPRADADNTSEMAHLSMG